MPDKVIFRTPMKQIRVLIGLLCWLFGGFSIYAIVLQPSNWLMSSLIAVGMILSGLAAAFAEKVCVLDGEKKTLSSAWFFANMRVGVETLVSVSEANAVKLAVVEMRMHHQPGRVMKASKAFPVWIMSGEKSLGHVIGWKQPEDPQSERGEWDRCMFNSAWFPEYARYVAAVCAKTLDRPLIDRMNDKEIPASEIPQDWLDIAKVRFKMKWERV